MAHAWGRVTGQFTGMGAGSAYMWTHLSMDESSSPSQAGDDRTPSVAKLCACLHGLFWGRVGMPLLLRDAGGHFSPPLTPLGSGLPSPSPFLPSFPLLPSSVLGYPPQWAQGHLQVGGVLVLQFPNLPASPRPPGPVCVDIWFFLCVTVYL